MTARSTAIAAAIAAAAVSLAIPASAVDGEILIDQAKVNAGGITPGDAPGFPATLSRPGRYKLAGNLRVPAGQTGVEVTQSDVTIDLNGFTISSNPPAEANAGVKAFAGGFRVMNGTIASFRLNGVVLFGERAVVEDMRILSSGDGVHTGYTEARIRDNTISNGRNGIVCSRCLVERNVVTGNSETGIMVSEGGVVLGNVIASNGSYGLRSNGFPNTGYGNNILFGNGAHLYVGMIQLHANVCEPACP